jgi:hypothetical protein
MKRNFGSITNLPETSHAGPYSIGWGLMMRERFDLLICSIPVDFLQVPIYKIRNIVTPLIEDDAEDIPPIVYDPVLNIFDHRPACIIGLAHQNKTIHAFGEGNALWRRSHRRRINEDKIEALP